MFATERPLLLPPLLARPLQYAVHAQPAHQCIEPAGAGRFLGVHAKPVSALFVEVKLDRPLRRDPALDQPHAPAPEEGIIDGERDDHWRRFSRDFRWLNRYVD